jgi:hypothetical protein
VRVSLFATSSESVRLVCQEQDAGLIELHVFGPKEQRASYTFNSLETCDQFRAAIELKLLRNGFSLLANNERRRAG